MKKILSGISLIISANLFAQQDEIYTKNNIAINGYDAVAYFTQGMPVKGNSADTIFYKGATWLFSTAANAGLFKNNPEKYEPQYGGYCAFGCSGGYKAKTSPDAWTIVNGKLYLNYDTRVRETWIKDREQYIKKADTNWIHIRYQKYN